MMCIRMNLPLADYRLFTDILYQKEMLIASIILHLFTYFLYNIPFIYILSLLNDMKTCEGA
jgi:hypothetical protein